jgi:hypothetical protein
MAQPEFQHHAVGAFQILVPLSGDLCGRVAEPVIRLLYLRLSELSQQRDMEALSIQRGE